MTQARLYPVAPEAADPESLIAPLREMAAKADIAALRLPEALAAKPGAAKLVQAAQALNIAVVVENDAGLAARLKADGVETAGRLATREGFAILGARCGTSRHEAMSLGEAGADYVAIAPELIEWWAGLFEIPCVCESPLAPEQAKAAAEAGADFLVPAMDVWDNPATITLYGLAP